MLSGTVKVDDYIIRPLQIQDADSYYNLIERNRSRLENFFAGTCAKNKSIEDTRRFVPEVIEKESRRVYFPFVIIEASSQSLIGYIDIKSVDWTIPKAEIGFFIDERYEGKGIVTKMLAKIIDHCFDELGFQKLFLRTHEHNIGSRIVAEKNGFEVEGIIRSDYRTTSGVVVDLIYYGLLKKNFNEVNQS